MDLEMKNLTFNKNKNIDLNTLSPKIIEKNQKI